MTLMQNSCSPVQRSVRASQRRTRTHNKTYLYKLLLCFFDKNWYIMCSFTYPQGGSDCATWRTHTRCLFTTTTKPLYSLICRFFSIYAILVLVTLFVPACCVRVHIKYTFSSARKVFFSPYMLFLYHCFSHKYVGYASYMLYCIYVVICWWPTNIHRRYSLL